ncbi:MAG: hypothetical protein AAF581_11900 [Planctomycetota bacterium]
MPRICTIWIVISCLAAVSFPACAQDDARLSVGVQIEDRAGRPVVGAQLQFRRDRAAGRTGYDELPQPRSGVTDGLGRWQCAAIRASWDNLEVKADGYATRVVSLEHFVGKDDVDFTIVIERSGALRVDLRHANGAPARVQLRWRSLPPYIRCTGSAELTNLPPGKSFFTVWVTDPRPHRGMMQIGSFEVEIVEGQTTEFVHTLQADSEPVRITGTVRKNGVPLSQGTVTVTGLRIPPRAAVDEDGRFSLQAAPGRQRLTYSPPGDQIFRLEHSVSKTVDVTSGAHIHFDFTTVQCHGVVRIPGGQLYGTPDVKNRLPLYGSVAFSPPPPRFFGGAFADADTGEFEVELHSGSYKVWWSSSDTRYVMLPRTLEIRDSTPIELFLTPTRPIPIEIVGLPDVDPLFRLLHCKVWFTTPAGEKCALDLERSEDGAHDILHWPEAEGSATLSWNWQEKIALPAVDLTKNTPSTLRVDVRAVVEKRYPSHILPGSCEAIGFR